jgi:hypothetical protein
MFGRKKPETQPEKLDVYEQNLRLLDAARRAGDKKSEIILSLVAVADDAMKMRAAQNRIIDLFDDRLDEVLSDSSLYFPTDLAVRLREVRDLFDQMDDDVQHASSSVTDLVKQLAAHVKK